MIETVPEPEMESEAEVETEPEPRMEPAPIPKHRPKHMSPAAPEPEEASVPAVLRMPNGFNDEVYVNDTMLSFLYGILPPFTPVLEVLEEDWAAAKASDEVGASGRDLVFPLRYQAISGEGRTLATIARIPRMATGKSWALTALDGEDGSGPLPESVGFEGLPLA